MKRFFVVVGVQSQRKKIKNKESSVRGNVFTEQHVIGLVSMEGLEGPEK